MYIRYCPTCNKELQYKSLSGFRSSNKYNKSCKRCSCKNRAPMSNDIKSKISKTLMGHTVSDKSKLQMSDSQKRYLLTHPESRLHLWQPGNSGLKGLLQSEETKRKIGQSNKISQVGKKHSEETKHKMRIARLKIMSENGRNEWTNSKSETLFFDILEEIYNIKIRRNFWIEDRVFDGQYKNVIIEVDSEYWHNVSSNILNDYYKDFLALEYNFILLRIIINDVREVKDIISYYKSEWDKYFIDPHICIPQVSCQTVDAV